MKAFIIRELSKRKHELLLMLNDAINNSCTSTELIEYDLNQLESAIQWVKDSPDDDNNILSDDLAQLNDGKLTQYPNDKK